MPYSLDLRIKIVAAHDAGQSIRKIAKNFGVSPTTVLSYVKAARENGGVTPAKPGGGRRPTITEAALGLVQKLIGDNPAATLAAMSGELQARLGVRVTPQALGRRLKKEGFTFKKKRRAL